MNVKYGIWSKLANESNKKIMKDRTLPRLRVDYWDDGDLVKESDRVIIQEIICEAARARITSRFPTQVEWEVFINRARPLYERLAFLDGENWDFARPWKATLEWPEDRKGDGEEKVEVDPSKVEEAMAAAAMMENSELVLLTRGGSFTMAEAAAELHMRSAEEVKEKYGVDVTVGGSRVSKSVEFDGTIDHVEISSAGGAYIALNNLTDRSGRQSLAVDFGAKPSVEPAIAMQADTNIDDNRCKDCRGSGEYVGAFEREPCQRCKGSGREPSAEYENEDALLEAAHTFDGKLGAITAATTAGPYIPASP